MTPLMAVPNVSEGRDPEVLEAIGRAFASNPPVRLLDRHADPDHHRAVYTLAGPPGQLALALLAGARQAVSAIDLDTPRGIHPHVGAIDVVPVVHLDPTLRGAAVVEALLTADLLAGELGLPVFLYGVLAGGRTRAELRRGGAPELWRRVLAGELQPDFGPHRPHPRAGAVLVGARPPLVAFNLELAPPAGLDTARRIAAAIRHGGSDGLPGVRAIGLALAARGGRAQVSVNVEDADAVPLAAVVRAVSRHAPLAAAELVGLAPRAAFHGFPDDLPLAGFDPARHIIENVLAG
ncbi:MAG: glutamate formiminotransferase / 5-formyltetrahydrofolate cyclo-ligase [Solirubrobacteraceae bacterium]|jgi:glutamate formiminotransferase/glutamate formiminotransferase/formiminotetrahydrofolate cyclodeaminase|nr:glutamate formiminotransferase / 5-formyltetrahydrofolate cyclo-ligase [Solirubrobacteraceae bacterium]